ncbi:MAG: hypothetical protein Phog2KO_43330 [Phototrophicaceae bacterium]
MLVIRYGWDKVTLEEISRDAHVSKSTFYNAWQTKERLFETVFNHDWELFLSHWQDFFQNGNKHYSARVLEGLLISLSEYPLVRRTIIAPKNSNPLYLSNRHNQCWQVIEANIQENYDAECQNAIEFSRASVLVAYGFATAVEQTPLQNITVSDWLTSIRVTTNVPSNHNI